MDKLTPKQERFVRNYLKNGFNGTQAAIDAGYSKKTARFIAAQNLTKLNVKAFIDQAKKEVDDENIMTATEVLRELSIVGRCDLKNHIEIDPDTGAIRAKGFNEMGETSRALESISEDRAIKENSDGSSVTVYDKVKFKMHSKIQALDKLGQYRNLWNNKDDQKQPITIIVQKW